MAHAMAASGSDGNGAGSFAGITAPEASARIQQELRAVGIPDAAYETRSILRAALGVSRERLLTDRDLVISTTAAKQIQIMVRRRAAREPLQYILGSVEFYGRDFIVDERVLIPRPETELLVEQALAFARERKLEKPRVLDIGTGSGILAITIAAELPESSVVATDISAEALQVARTNADANGVSASVTFVECSLADDVEGPFSIIVTNPPYVLTRFLDSHEVQPELAREPRGALDGGADGMDVYRPLITALPALMSETSSIAVIEIDPPVTQACIEEAKLHFSSGVPNAEISVLTDLAGLERALVIERG